MNETTENEPVDLRPDPPGRRLRHAREKKGLSQAEVAKSMRLTVQMVDILERDDFEHFPAATFVKGYLRNYAAQVDLPADELVDAYNHHITDMPVQSHASSRLHHFKETKAASKSAALWVLGLVLVVGLVILWFYWPGKDDQVNADVETASAAAQQGADQFASPGAIAIAPEEHREPLFSEQKTEEAPVTEAPVTEPAPEHEVVSEGEPVQQPATLADADKRPDEDEVVTAAQADVVAPSPEKTRVESLVLNGSVEEYVNEHALPGEAVLYFKADAWVEARDGKRARILYQLCRAGKLYRIHGVQPFTFKLGNASRVDVYFDGKPVDIGAYTEKNVARFSLGES